MPFMTVAELQLHLLRSFSKKLKLQAGVLELSAANQALTVESLHPHYLHKLLCFLIYEAEASLISSTEINPCNLLSAKHFEVEGCCTRCGQLKAHNVIKLLQRLKGFSRTEVVTATLHPDTDF